VCDDNRPEAARAVVVHAQHGPDGRHPDDRPRSKSRTFGDIVMQVRDQPCRRSRTTQRTPRTNSTTTTFHCPLVENARSSGIQRTRTSSAVPVNVPTVETTKVQNRRREGTGGSTTRTHRAPHVPFYSDPSVNRRASIAMGRPHRG